MLKRLAIENRRKMSRQLFFQLHQEADVAISCSTVRRRLHESELDSRRPRKKPLLTDEHRRLRREWAATYCDWDVEVWRLSFLVMKPKLALEPTERCISSAIREKSICRNVVI